ncbi:MULTISPECIES: hypothetical protein [unclassified Sphingobacterium]|uniref:hypothetical protein n=1 Tax=unclassified Sphingobacterium TaxID=2609468 RepID=UPI0020C4D708|nr:MULTISPECIES: hypothetical protein [unclassified Sphingobacterium]
MYKIGYIDEDKGWRSTFRQYLKDDFEIVLFDINEETTVETLVDDVFNQAMDMLVIDFRLDETGLVDFNADTLVDKIQERNLYYPLIILTSFESDALDHLENANLVNGKDMLSGDNSSKVSILKQKISKIANDYISKMKETVLELEILEKRRVKNGLEPNEEDRFVELNNYLDKTTSAKGRLSRTFYSEDTNKKLDELICKTEQLLKQIMFKNEPNA